jgi:isopentenyl-diphosphate delta-isomerase
MTENVILVDENDSQIGIGEKLETHRLAKLHRAFSVLIYNTKGEMMLQLRAKTKYHGGGLWTNACCGHPRPNEDLMAAMKRRLGEEMGFECELKKVFDYVYMVPLDKGMNEHEFLHVYKGIYDGIPNLNRDEAEGWKWISMKELRKDIKNNPQNYTPWFRLSMEKLV